ncbi:DUF3290 family protein [Fructilactobacillus lindneri]|uniref:DUF3290 family protein n=1 Tax=Fructilactobacillus lindneri TaxID=53444 RepID=UPI000CD3EA0F|nr:DUF3290 family protein [Fructilactobacillus lindneri]
MNLYSYDYLKHNYNITNQLFIGLMALIFFIIIVVGLFYYRNRNNPRFRNLFILVSLSGALVIAIQTGQTVQVLKKIADQKHVSVDDVYASSNALNDGMTVQIGKKYYVVNFNNDQSNYNLKETQLVNPPKHVNKAQFNFGFGGTDSNGVDYGSIALKFIVGLIMVVLQINLSGKGNLTPSNALDQLQNYILGGIIGGIIYNSQITVLQFVVILLIWSVIVFTIKFLTGQSNSINKLINGTPQVLILDGKVNVTRALNTGVNANELAFKLRTDGVSNFRDVKNATLEQNGQLTVTTFKDQAINYPIIADGQINKLVMERAGITEPQLVEMLKKQHTIIPDVYLAQLNNGKLNVVKYPMKSRILRKFKR